MVKREHEDSNLSLVEKKQKPVIPNWKNLKDKNIPVPQRYFDAHLYDMRNQCQSIISSREHDLSDIPFYAFSLNVLCKERDGKTFVPIEIAIYAYSLKAGKIGKCYHVLIDAGSVPMGCLNAAMDHSALHKISFQNGNYPKNARSDYKKIYKEMLSYTKQGERTLLITALKDMPQVVGGLEWLYNKASEGDSKFPKISTWTILPVTEFVATMYNHVFQKMLGSPQPRFALHYYIKICLDGSVMDYNKALSCSYHSQEENETKWCAQSCAMKMFSYIEGVLDDIFNMFEKAISLQALPCLQTSQNTLSNPALPVPPNNPALPAPQSKGFMASPSSEEIRSLPVAKPVLAIEGPSSGNPELIMSRDPRHQHGRLKPDLNAVPTISLPPDNDQDHYDIFNETSVSVESTKKPEEPLIIASQGNGMLENPPDIF